MSTHNTLLQLRLAKQEKQDFSRIAESYGVKPTQLLRMFIIQTNRTKKPAVSFDNDQGHIPNAQTTAILTDIDNLPRYTLDDPNDILKW